MSESMIHRIIGELAVAFAERRAAPGPSRLTTTKHAHADVQNPVVDGHPVITIASVLRTHCTNILLILFTSSTGNRDLTRQSPAKLH